MIMVAKPAYIYIVRNGWNTEAGIFGGKKWREDRGRKNWWEEMAVMTQIMV
jgi:hypothetical protein